MQMAIYASSTVSGLDSGFHAAATGRPMTSISSSSYLDAVRALAPQIAEYAEESERARRLSPPLVDALAEAGLFRLWIPRAFAGEEVDAMTFVEVVEATSRVDGATGWCVMIGGCYGAFGGYLPAMAAREIYGSDPRVVSGGTFRPLGEAVVVDGGYRASGHWPLGSGCQHCSWMVGGCRIVDGDKPRLRADGTQVTRLLFFSGAGLQDYRYVAQRRIAWHGKPRLCSGRPFRTRRTFVVIPGTAG
jgi:indole-3-acetate monooxygenase